MTGWTHEIRLLAYKLAQIMELTYSYREASALLAWRSALV